MPRWATPSPVSMATRAPQQQQQHLQLFRQMSTTAYSKNAIRSTNPLATIQDMGVAVTEITLDEGTRDDGKNGKGDSNDPWIAKTVQAIEHAAQKYHTRPNQAITAIQGLLHHHIPFPPLPAEESSLNPATFNRHNTEDTTAKRFSRAPDTEGISGTPMEFSNTVPRRYPKRRRVYKS